LMYFRYTFSPKEIFMNTKDAGTTLLFVKEKQERPFLNILVSDLK
jgi:hypothetical protein